MKTILLLLALCCLTVSLWGQTPAQPPASPAQIAPLAHHATHHRTGTAGDHMGMMKSQVAKMRATLDKMKANLPNLKDPAVNQQAQLDVDMWEAMVEHMEGMEKMMSAHHGMGMGMGGGMGMGMEMMGGMHHGEHHHDMECKGDDCPKMPAPPAAPDKPAPPNK